MKDSYLNGGFGDEEDRIDCDSGVFGCISWDDWIFRAVIEQSYINQTVK